jgi:BMFP domain-containing protein YqiC
MDRAMPTNPVETVLTELRKLVPEGLGANIERNLRAALTGVFERLDLVTREELEVQEHAHARAWKRWRSGLPSSNPKSNSRRRNN